MPLHDVTRLMTHQTEAPLSGTGVTLADRLSFPGEHQHVLPFLPVSRTFLTKQGSVGIGLVTVGSHGLLNPLKWLHVNCKLQENRHMGAAARGAHTVPRGPLVPHMHEPSCDFNHMPVAVCACAPRGGESHCISYF